MIIVLDSFNGFIITYISGIIQGFCQLKENPKIREKLGSGWVCPAPTRICFLFWKFCVFCAVFVVVHVSKKQTLDRGVGG